MAPPKQIARKSSAPPPKTGRTAKSAKTAPAKKTDPAKPKGVKKTTKRAAPANDVSYVVYSLQEYPPDGFHSYHPGERTVDSTHKTLKAANKRAEELFYEGNPWGWGRDEFDEQDVDENTDTFGCVELMVHPDDSEIWKVKVDMVKGK